MTFYLGAPSTAAGELDARQTLALLRNKKVKLVSRPGEARDAFEVRCQAAATAQTRVRRAEDKIDSKRDRFEDLQRELESEAETIKLKWANIAFDIEDLDIGLEKTTSQ